jgi:hypothetical protein
MKPRTHQLLPTPVITSTRWDTCLNNIAYYPENVQISFSVVNELDRADASSIAILRETFNDSNELKTPKST